MYNCCRFIYKYVLNALQSNLWGFVYLTSANFLKLNVIMTTGIIHTAQFLFSQLYNCWMLNNRVFLQIFVWFYLLRISNIPMYIQNEAFHHIFNFGSSIDWKDEKSYPASSQIFPKLFRWEKKNNYYFYCIQICQKTQ